MRKTGFWLLAAVTTLAGAGLTALPAAAAGKTTTTAPKATPPKPKDLGGPMPLPVDQRIERQNKPSDKLLVEVTKSAAEGTHYVAYVKVAWGDLDNLIKGTGSQYYSDWDGSLTVSGGTAAIDEKIQFDDGSKEKKPAKENAKEGAKATTKATAKPAAGPGPGSGRDQVEIAAGPKVEWKAGVVGVLDGLRLKITSPTPAINATLVAGKFTIPIVIGSATQPPAGPVASSEQLIAPPHPKGK